MLGRVEGEGGDIVWIDGVADEATSGMRIETDHEEECQVVGVPERLKALVAHLVVCCGVHQEHDEEHEVARDGSSLGVMNV